MMRTARDYICGIGKEAAWSQPPTRFDRIQLLAEDLRVTGQYEGRRVLSEDRIAAPQRLVRTHVEGGFALAAGHAALRRLLPLVTGGSWTTPDAQGGTTLAVDGAADAVSLSLIRRLAAADDWQLFSGLRVQQISLFPGADGGLHARASCLGGAQQARTGLAVAGTAATEAGLRPAAPPSGLRLRPDPGQDVGALYLAGVEITLSREGMRPHFALGTNAPQMITPGLLVARVGLRLLANDAAKAASRHDHLAASFRFEDATGHVDLELGRLGVTARREIADAGGGPALIQLAFRAEISGGALCRLRYHPAAVPAVAGSAASGLG